MLSASEKPTVIYLQNLTLKTPAIQLHPSASNAAIATASFHPERSNVFLLAFKDGTIAAYDATRLARNCAPHTGSASRPVTNGQAGEISHFSNLHRITSIREKSDPPDASPNTAVGSKSVSITGAAFLPGFRTRAISVGADGRCRLVDFEAGGKILRTWHAQAPVTSLSISAFKSSAQLARTASKQRAGVNGSGLSDNTVVAVGRVDGQVLLFDSVGLRLDQVLVNALGEKVINVEWMNGPSPYAIPTPVKPVSAKIDAKYDKLPDTPGKKMDAQPALPDALRLPPGAVFVPVQPVPAITVYEPDVEDMSTVRYTPAAETVISSPSNQTTYLDLFSPVKKVSLPRRPQKSPVSSPNLRRKRISSQTFVKTNSPESVPTNQEAKEGSFATPTHMSIHPLNTTIEPVRGSPTRIAPASARRGPRSGRKRANARYLQGPNRSPIHSAGARRNGEVLADLRKLNMGISSQAKKNGKAALFAPYMNRTGISNLPRADAQPKVKDNIIGNVQSLEHTHDSRPHLSAQSPKVHFESESHSSDRDIWVSAGSSGDERTQWNDKRPHHHVRQRQVARPYRQTLSLAKRPNTHSVPDTPAAEREALTEITAMSAKPHNAGKEAAVLSMSEEAMYSAVSHISNIDGEFVPASRDVQTVFPRGSSIYSTSPSRQSPKRSPQRKVQVWNDGAPETKTTLSPVQRAKLVNTNPNTIVKATPREAATKKAVAVLLGSEGTQGSKVLPQVPCLRSDIIPLPPQPCACAKKNCRGCAELGARVQSLEEEVARLKAEVLGLRSALRKTGVWSRVAEKRK